MKLRHIALIGSLFPFLLAIVLFFGVLISAEDDDGGGGSSSWVTGMNLSAEVLKHQPMVEKYAKEYGISEYVPYLLAIIQVEIQASLYPNSEYLTNNESFHKEFDIYFPSQVHLHNFLVLLFPVVLLPVIIRIIISAIIISSTEFLSPVIGEIIRIIIIINIIRIVSPGGIRIAVCIV